MFFDDPVRLYDCSNSDERPSHRGGGGPIMNDVMRHLHEHDEDYYYKFVTEPEEAEVIVTNDVFPKSVINLGKPLVKRMCGPFWQKDMQTRNEPLAIAAVQADLVIFISEYSRQQYFYNDGLALKRHVVVRHWVDPKIYYPVDVTSNNQFTMAACATNWNRKEKRLGDLIRFAEANPQIQFLIIGTVEQELPSNFIKIGYLDKPEDIAYILNSADGFVNLSYRDAATKTVPQAINCGLPVLYADSGGVGEMVKNPFPDSGPDFGIAITDNQCLDVETDVPELNLDDMQKAFSRYRNNFGTIKAVALETFDRQLAFNKMLDGYFGAISHVVDR